MRKYIFFITTFVYRFQFITQITWPSQVSSNRNNIKATKYLIVTLLLMFQISFSEKENTFKSLIQQRILYQQRLALHQGHQYLQILIGEIMKGPLELVQIINFFFKIAIIVVVEQKKLI